MTTSRIRACQRYKVLRPHFQLDCQRSEVLLPHFRFVLTAKDLKFRFRTSALHWLPKIWSYASILHWLSMIWSSAFASPLCLNYPWCDMSSVSHFCSTNSSKDVKFRFRTSVLPWLPKIWSSASALLLWSFASALLLWSFASALPLCLDCQRCEVPLSKLLFCQERKSSSSASALVRSGLPKMWRSNSAFHLCRDFQRCEVPLPYFCSALTAKDMKFGFPAKTLL